MFLSDFSYIFFWWMTIFILGLIFLPLTSRLFGKFIDKGYIFSKVLAIILLSYLVWLLSSLHILTFSRIGVILIVLAVSLINLWIFKAGDKKNKEKSPVLFIIIEETLFFLCLAFWSYVRATEPSIRGLEKFMDFGFVNSILRADFFPPLDMWLTKSPDYTGGYFINYYYYGHYVTAFLTKLTGIDSAVTYNLMLATLFAFTFTLSFSIGANLYNLFSTLILKTGNTSTRNQHTAANARSVFAFGQTSQRIHRLKIILVGLLAGFLVALGGNLHTIYTLTEGYPNEEPKPFWQIPLGYHPEKYWYPNATRFIPFTIHEFPIYSFVVADLHGHVSDIPFVLFAIALIFSILLDKKETKENSQKQENSENFLDEFENRYRVSFFKIILLGINLSVLYMTNAWDGIIYLTLSLLVICYLNFQKEDGLWETLKSSLVKTISAGLFLFFFFLVFNLPFSLHFKPFVSGIGVLCAPKFLADKTFGPFLFEAGKCQKSPFYMLALLWGFFYFNALSYLLLIVLPNLKKRWTTNRMTFQRVTTYHLQLTTIDIFILTLIILSTLLLVFPEFFYIKDIYPAHYRANTMFKLGYQAFMMLGIASAYILFRIKESTTIKNMGKSFYKAFFVLLFSFVAIYPYFAINSYYNGLSVYHGLNGLNWLNNQYPSDFEAIEWLRESITGQPVIVEANGDSYTDYARVSANTGLPTIIGWPVHEWLWRGSYDEAGKRIPEVATIYEDEDLEKTKSILKKYNVEYIFLGLLEREKYKNINEEKINSLGSVVFESGNTKIYKVNL